jgi:hypothetical protein
VFRKLFGSEENKDLLISLINSILMSSMTPEWFGTIAGYVKIGP